MAKEPQAFVAYAREGAVSAALSDKASMNIALSRDPIQKIRVMSFNIRHGKGLDGKIDLKRIAAVIRGADPDIVGLQEVDRWHPRSGFCDQPTKLAKLLGMHMAFAPSMRWGPVHYGNILLSKFDILRHRIIRMSGLTERRCIQLAEVNIRGQLVTVLNTHLGYMEREKAKQLPILRSVLAKVKQPAILMGDFNMGANDTRLRQLGPGWLKSKLAVKHPTVQSGREIDHIFSKLPGGKSKAWVQPTDASDHHPVIADLEWLQFQLKMG